MADATETTTTTTTTTDPAASAGAAAAVTNEAAVSPANAGAAAAAETKDAPDAGKGEQQQQQAAPVDYAKAIGEVTMPEGMTLDPTLAKAGGELFAKHGISAEAAKELVSMYASQQKAGAEASAKAFSDQVGAWRADAEKATTAEQRGAAKEAVLKAFPKELVSVMEHFGLTNRADFIRSMAAVGKSIRNDTYVPGNAAGNGARDPRAMFPNSNMNP